MLKVLLIVSFFTPGNVIEIHRVELPTLQSCSAVRDILARRGRLFGHLNLNRQPQARVDCVMQSQPLPKIRPSQS